MDWRKIMQQTWVVAVVIFVANVLLKIATVDYASLYVDEAASIFYAQESWSDWWEYVQRDSNPPLHFLLLKGWVSLFGISEVSVRGLSVLFSSGAAVVLYLLVKRYASSGAAWISVALFTMSNIQLHYAQEARGFALVVLLTTLSFWYYMRLFKDEKPKAAIGLLVANALLLLTHYSAMFVPVVQAIGLLLWIKKPRKLFLYWLAANVLIILALLPEWLTLNADKIGNTSKWYETPNMTMVYNLLKSLFGSKVNLLAGGLLIGLGIGLTRTKYMQARKLFYISMLWLLGCLGLAFAMSFYVPMLSAKYMLYTSVGLYILIGITIDSFPFKGNAHMFAVLALIIGIGLGFQSKQSKGEDWKGAVAWLDVNRGNADVLITRVYNNRAFAYHYDRQAFAQPDSMIHKLYEQGIYATDKMDQQFFEYTYPNEMVVMRAHYKPLPPEEDPIEVMKTRYTQLHFEQFQGIEVFYFVKK